MKAAALLLLLSFYMCGTLLLPLGDFSALTDVRSMYEHCKATEDNDLDVFEFATEHLSGVGQLLAGLEHEDDRDEDGDKPHAPVQFHFQWQVIYCNLQPATLPLLKPTCNMQQAMPVCNRAYVACYVSEIFRPPIM
jgi:hypothetical protein